MNYMLYIQGLNNNLYTYQAKNNIYKIGEFVNIIFNNKKTVGLILYEDKTNKHDFKINKILSKIKEQPPHSPELIKLFLWMKDYYLCNFKDILNISRPKYIQIAYTKKIIFNKLVIPINENEKLFIEYIKNKKIVARSTVVLKFGKTVVDKFIKSKIVLEQSFIKENRPFKKNKNSISYSYHHDNCSLTKEQLEVKNKIITGAKKYYLLKGVTGSGKTEIYISLIKDALKENSGSIFLLPEISLTPQMINRVKKEFNNVAILHSKLTPKERGLEWQSIYSGEKQVVLGVRSAVFAPVKNLKYIIIDEEHESTYKQDNNPRYNAKYVALKRGELENIKVILASATPSIESYYYATQNIFQLLELKNRFGNAIEPSMRIVDMREQQRELLSEYLINNISIRLRKSEQILLLLNRKGFSTSVQCHNCGHVELCPHCSISLSYYKKNSSYKCSYCDYKKQYYNICSNCNEKTLKFTGSGTEKLEIELEKLFDTPILRVDSETTKKRGAYGKIYSDFLNQKYKIMIGTQMISKGFHFPETTLVGIINSDSILNFPDFRASEKTFQLITQTAGRAGRGEKKGEVIIQTYQPNNYVIQKVLKNDYVGFYEEEISTRKILNYPPFSRIINIIISSKIEIGLKEYTKSFYNKIKSSDIEIYGPMEPPIYKISEYYRSQIFIKSDRISIINIKQKISTVLDKFKSNNKYRITVDVDPINLM